MSNSKESTLPMDSLSDDDKAIPPPGEESSFPLTAYNDKSLRVRHGSSLSLMSQVCEFLANPVQDDSFNYVDPTADHHKWARRGMQLYYAAVVDSSTGNLLCALRAATEGMMVEGNPSDNDGESTSCATKKRKLESTEKNNHNTNKSTRKRFLIDYVYTAPESRDKGIAGLLVRQVLELAQNATCYVLSIEDSCVYWMEKHKFFLCQSPALNKLLNLFPDTHLLKRRRGQSGDNDDHENDSDEEDAKIRVQQQGLSSSDSSDSDSSTSTASAEQQPSESFRQALAQLLDHHERSEGLRRCLSSLAVLIRNAVQADSTDDRKKCKIRLDNPNVHRRVFAVGGDAAMKLLQACGFELEVNDQGDAVLHFHSDPGRASWLMAAVAQLEQEATK